MADGIKTVRDIADPVGMVTESWQRPNGMTIERVRVPLGVVAVIFESRPNVAADAGVLCLKSGNAVSCAAAPTVPLLPRDPRLPGSGFARSRPAGSRDHAGAHP